MKIFNGFVPKFSSPYQAVINNLREGLVIYEIKTGEIVLVNQLVQNIFKVPAGQKIDIFSHLVDSPFQTLKQCNDAPSDSKLSWICGGKAVTGEDLWLNLHYTVVEMNRRPVGLLLISDLTQQKKTEAILQNSEMQYKTLSGRVERQSREMELMTQIRLAIANEIDLSVLIQKTVDTIRNIFGYHKISLLFVEGEELVVQYNVGYSQFFNHISIHQGVCGRVARQKKAELVKDVNADPDYFCVLETIKSEICVPILDEGIVVGILNIESASDLPLDENDLRTLVEVCYHLGFAINRARLYTETRHAAEHLRRQNAYLNALHDTTLGLINRLDLKDLLDDIIQRTGQLMDSENGYLYQYRPSSGYLELTHGVGIYQQYIGLRLKPGEGIGGEVFKTGKPMIVENYDQWVNRYPTMPTGLFHATIGVPIFDNQQVIGVLGISYLNPKEKINTTKAEVVTRFAQMVSLAIGNARLYTSMQQELSMRERIEDALRASEERYALVVRGANDGFWDWDLTSGKIYYSPRWVEMMGLDGRSTTDSIEEWFSRVKRDDLPPLKEAIDLHLNGQSPKLECQCRILYNDGDYRWMLVRGLAVQELGKAAHRLVGSITDISEMKENEERLRHDAMHDPLTGLPNRRYFIDQIHHCLERCKRKPDYKAAVLFLDLDRFKLVNESLSHSTGDGMLIDIARRLGACLRAGDIIARFGGDEFGILVDDISEAQDAIRVSNRIQQELSHPFILQGHEIFTSASIGIAVFSPAYNHPEEILRDADTAMYQAKSGGRSRHQVFDKEMHARSMSLLKLEADLRRALEKKEFVLYYQPIISLTTGQITSLEVLIRWLNPDRGLVGPDQFIGLAEETGLIVPIGEFVLYQACTQGKKWLEDGNAGLKIAINLSARQLQDSNLTTLIKQVLDTTGFPPSALHLEITESAAMKDFELTIQTITDIRKMGVQFSIDDFGTSYSSMNYLKRFPVSTIKIDRTFIRDIMRDPDDAAITSAIIAMGHILNLSLIAEGVEDQDQLSFLCRQKCDECQGFLFYKPMPANLIPNLLTEKRNLISGYISEYPDQVNG